MFVQHLHNSPSLQSLSVKQRFPQPWWNSPSPEACWAFHWLTESLGLYSLHWHWGQTCCWQESDAKMTDASRRSQGCFQCQMVNGCPLETRRGWHAGRSEHILCCHLEWLFLDKCSNWTAKVKESKHTLVWDQDQDFGIQVKEKWCQSKSLCKCSPHCHKTGTTRQGHADARIRRSAAVSHKRKTERTMQSLEARRVCLPLCDLRPSFRLKSLYL